jgi:hypothetical protein
LLDFQYRCVVDRNVGQVEQIDEVLRREAGIRGWVCLAEVRYQECLQYQPRGEDGRELREAGENKYRFD